MRYSPILPSSPSRWGKQRIGLQMLTVTLVWLIMENTSRSHATGIYLTPMVHRQFSVLAPYFCVWCILRYCFLVTRSALVVQSTSYRHSSYYPRGLTEWLPTSPKGFHRLKRPPSTN